MKHPSCRSTDMRRNTTNLQEAIRRVRGKVLCNWTRSRKWAAFSSLPATYPLCSTEVKQRKPRFIRRTRTEMRQMSLHPAAPRPVGRARLEVHRPNQIQNAVCPPWLIHKVPCDPHPLNNLGFPTQAFNLQLSRLSTYWRIPTDNERTITFHFGRCGYVFNNIFVACRVVGLLIWYFKTKC